MVKAAYTTRLGGEGHLNSYHWERPMSELEALDRQDDERQGEVDEGGPRARSKRKMESCPFCVRSFTDKENLKEHMRSDHFDS